MCDVSYLRTENRPDPRSDRRIGSRSRSSGTGGARAHRHTPFDRYDFHLRVRGTVISRSVYRPIFDIFPDPSPPARSPGDLPSASASGRAFHRSAFGRGRPRPSSGARAIVYRIAGAAPTDRGASAHRRGRANTRERESLSDTRVYRGGRGMSMGREERDV